MAHSQSLAANVTKTSVCLGIIGKAEQGSGGEACGEHVAGHGVEHTKGVVAAVDEEELLGEEEANAEGIPHAGAKASDESLFRAASLSQ